MGVLHEDKELVGEVFHLMEEVIEIRDVLKAGLIDLAKAWSDEEPNFNIDFTQGAVSVAKEAAQATFERMDLDKGGSLSYREFRMGLDTYKIHLPKREFKKLIRVIDPDQSGELDLKEWTDFFSMSEEDIVEQSMENNNPKGVGVMSNMETLVGGPAMLSGMVGGKALDLISGVDKSKIFKSPRGTADGASTPDKKDKVNYQNPMTDDEERL